MATPTADLGANIFATGADEHPAADGSTASESPGTDPATATHDACAGEAGTAPPEQTTRWRTVFPQAEQARLRGATPDKRAGSTSPRPAAHPRDSSRPPIAQGTRWLTGVFGPVAPRTTTATRGLPPHARRRSRSFRRRGGTRWRHQFLTARCHLRRRGCFGSRP